MKGSSVIERPATVRTASRRLDQRGPEIRVRTLLLGVLGVALVLAALAIVPALLRDEGSLPTTVGDEIPRGYTITYRVDAGSTVTTEVLTVRRPFGSRLVRHAGDSVDGRVLADRASDLGLLATSSGGPWGRIVVPPALASADLRPDAVLAAAVDVGLVEDLGASTVGGRACHEYRAATSFAGGTFLVPSPEEHAVACIDAVGLLLEETWTVDGEVVTTKRAIDLDLAVPSVDDVVVPAGEEVPGSGELREIAVSEPTPFAATVRLLDLPDGFEHLGRYAVVPPDLTPSQSTAAPPSAPTVATVTDVWVRGADVIILDQGATTRELPFPRSAVAAPVDISGRDAEVVLDLRATEVRIPLADGGFVRLSATLAPDEVVRLAQALQIEEGASDG